MMVEDLLSVGNEVPALLSITGNGGTGNGHKRYPAASSGEFNPKGLTFDANSLVLS
ncbi:MAG: hypothetical protein ACOC4Y_02065 [bacterium]